LNRQLIGKVKPSSTLMVVGFFVLCSMGIATAPLWSDKAFYPWERVDLRWLVGAAACLVMMVWMIPRYLLRLRASGGWGLWIQDGALHLVSRSKPMPLDQIDHVWLREKPFPTAVVALKDGKSVPIAAWSMDVGAHDLIARIEDARRLHR